MQNLHTEYFMVYPAIELSRIINSAFYNNLQNHWANIKAAEQHNVLFHRVPKLHFWPSFLLLVRSRFFSKASFQRNITVKGAYNSRDLKDTFWSDKCTRGHIKSFDSGLTTPLKYIRFRELSLTHTFFPPLPPFPFISSLIYLFAAQSPNWCRSPTPLSNYILSFFHWFSTSFLCVAFILYAELRKSSVLLRRTKTRA